MSIIIKGLRINQVPTANYFELDEYSGEYNDKIITEYEFLFLEEGKMFSKKFVIEEGACSSGYSRAAWLHESNQSEVSSLGTLHFIPKGKIEVDSFYTDYDGNDFFQIYENNCEYYPDANINIKKDNWIDTKRGKDKKQIYIFKGPSAIGKSFIAHNTNLSVYETDALQLEKLDILCDIIVIGNKHKFSVEDVTSRLQNEQVEFIIVKFKNYN